METAIIQVFGERGYLCFIPINRRPGERGFSSSDAFVSFLALRTKRTGKRFSSFRVLKHGKSHTVLWQWYGRKVVSRLAGTPSKNIRAVLSQSRRRLHQEMEPVHLEQQLELRQRQLQEIAGTFRVSREMSCQRVTHWQTGRYFATLGFAKIVSPCTFRSRKR